MIFWLFKVRILKFGSLFVVHLLVWCAIKFSGGARLILLKYKMWENLLILKLSGEEAQSADRDSLQFSMVCYGSCGNQGTIDSFRGVQAILQKRPRTQSH